MLCLVGTSASVHADALHVHVGATLYVAPTFLDVSLERGGLASLRMVALDIDARKPPSEISPEACMRASVADSCESRLLHGVTVGALRRLCNSLNLAVHAQQ
jgi:hypothetical protein